VRLAAGVARAPAAVGQRQQDTLVLALDLAKQMNRDARRLVEHLKAQGFVRRQLTPRDAEQLEPEKYHHEGDAAEHGQR
jgi:hypothetical protein